MRKLWPILLITTIFFVLFQSRYIFFFKYEPEYYEGLYYHSQWIYPSSTRGISDGELYKFVGYQLANGENPFNINFEIPPLGKYLYGLAEKYLGNPYWVSVLLFLLSTAVMFFLTKDLLKNESLSFLAALLFTTTPFVATQVSETMLDLPLMFFYLVQVFCFTKYLKKQNLKHLILAGIFLGLATGTKPGVFTPVVALFGFLMIGFLSRKAIHLFTYPISIFSGYILAFFCYFIKHPNPIPWLKLHQKSLEFYLLPENAIDHLHVWKSVFLNRYQGWWWNDRGTVGGASPVLPLGVLALFPVFYLAIKNKNFPILYLSAISLIFLIVNTFIPFFPRYLMTIVPLLIILTVFLFKKLPWLLAFFVLVNLPFLVSIFSPWPNGDAFALARFFSTRANHELYRSLTPGQRNQIPETDFIELNESFLEGLGVRKINAEVVDISRSGNKAEVKYQISLETKYGWVEHKPTLNFIKKKNQWRAEWPWSFLWPGFGPGSNLTIKEGSIPLAKIETTKEQTLAIKNPGKLVYVFPRVMFDWNKHLKLLSNITGETEKEVNERARRAVPDHRVRYIGYLNPAFDKEGIEKAYQVPGVELKETSYLTVLKEPELTAKLIGKLQKEKPELFYVRAEAFVENSQGQKYPILFKGVEQKETIIKVAPDYQPL